MEGALNAEIIDPFNPVVADRLEKYKISLKYNKVMRSVEEFKRGDRNLD